MKSIASLLSIIALGFGLLGCPGSGGGGGGGGTEGSGMSGSGTVVYLADQDSNGVFELYLATSGTKLNPSLVFGRTVTSFALTPDASAVIYIADQDQDNVFELYSVSVATPGVSTKLNPVLVFGQNVVEFAVTPDNSAVVYLADQTIDDTFELYWTILASGVNSRLNPAYTAGKDVDAFVILPNSSGVIYRADQNTDDVRELYRVLFATAPITTDRLVAPALAIGQNVGAFAATPDSANVVYIANAPLVSGPNQLFSVLAGGGGNIVLNHVLVPNGDVTDFAVTPDNSAVVYRSDQETNDVFELYRVNLAVPGISTKLNGLLASGGNVTTLFDVIPDSSGVVYIADQSTNNVFELFQTLFQGVNSQLNPPFIAPKNVVDFVLFPNSRGVVYRADQNTDGVNEIYSVLFGIPGSTRLNLALPQGQEVSTTYAVASDSSSAIYRANQDNLLIIELYQTSFSLPDSSTKLNSLLDVGKDVANFSVR
jgi:hypothetical protein